MAEEKDKDQVSKLMKAWEWVQTLGFIFGIIFLGSRETPTPGNEKAKASVPDWFIHAFPFFTKEDEIEFLMMLYMFPEKQLTEIETWFRKIFITKGYDETYYRLMLVGMWREFWDRIHNPPPENKNNGCEFEKITMGNPCFAFFQELLDKFEEGIPDKTQYEKMEKMGVDRGLLKKMGGMKKIGHWIWRHKLETIAIAWLILIAAICGVVNILMHIFYAFLG